MNLCKLQNHRFFSAFSCLQYSLQRFQTGDVKGSNRLILCICDTEQFFCSNQHFFLLMTVRRM